MSDWIKREAERIKAEQAAEEKRRAWEIHRSHLIEKKWGHAWLAIIDAVTTAALVFNGEFPDPSQHIVVEGDGRSLTISRSGATLRVLKIGAAEAGIHLHLIETDHHTHQVTKRDLHALPFTATSDGIVAVANNGGVLTPDVVSERILKNLL